MNSTPYLFHDPRRHTIPAKFISEKSLAIQKQTFITHINTVKEKLINATNVSFPIQILSIPETGLSSENGIILHPNLINECEAVIAAILAHEWGHIMNHHYPTVIPLTDFHEYQADEFAMKFLAEAGYSLEPIKNYNERNLMPLMRAYLRNQRMEALYNKALENMLKLAKQTDVYVTA